MVSFRFRILLLALSALLLLPGCGTRDESVVGLQERLNESNTRIRKLEDEKEKLTEENRQLAEQIAALNATIPGGLSLSEREKQLVEKEARLAQLESDLTARQASVDELERVIREAHSSLMSDKESFVEEKTDKLIEMGQAEQIVARYQEVVQERDSTTAQNRWLIIFIAFGAFLLLVCACGIVYLVFRNQITNRRIDAAIQYVHSADVSPQVKNSIAIALSQPQRLISHQDAS